MEEGAFDQAASTLRRAIAHVPAYTPAYVLLARAYEAQERWPEALAVWQRAHFFAPNSPTVEAGLLRMLDRHDAVFDEGAVEAAFAVDSANLIDEMADELIETIREDETASSERPADLSSETEETNLSEQELDVEDETETGSEADATATSATAEASPETPPDDTTDNEPSDDASTDDARSPTRLSPVEELAQRLPNPDQPLPSDVQDLDRLIDELEGARIDPQPDLEEAPPPDLDNDIEDMVSETLARIYISQKQFEEAARVYVRLAEQEPEREDEYLQKAADMRLRAHEQDDQ